MLMGLQTWLLDKLGERKRNIYANYIIILSKRRGIQETHDMVYMVFKMGFYRKIRLKFIKFNYVGWNAIVKFTLSKFSYLLTEYQGMWIQFRDFLLKFSSKWCKINFKQSKNNIEKNPNLFTDWFCDSSKVYSSFKCHSKKINTHESKNKSFLHL